MSKNNNEGLFYTVNHYIFCLKFNTGNDMQELSTEYGSAKPKNIISSILYGTPVKLKQLAISKPHDFRQVTNHSKFHKTSY